ncbi:hydroxyethylthiazole kinase [Roseiflexus sp.]|uniref:hydroxyethylthiazole kinase n=1 Tax=Roseiflexus sp. TaxID=2562120 RepID=UPI0021DDA239|nr:hydroxyethylthiazole kinase [Roseiflexus sp.]GIW03042.1 MAG: hydroxyethylthiazole kinase [Roseiflexus sp.]
MDTINQRIGEMLARVRATRPLIHHITNLVVMNDTANVTLHVGGLPVMAHDVEEVAEMVTHAGALVLNVGTLSPDWVESMLVAGRQANELDIPIVLDPVGAGATQLRTMTNLKLLRSLHIGVVRGNGGEIGALSGAGGEMRGVESIAAPENPLTAARTLAQTYRTVVALTGARDIITDGERGFIVSNGHIWLTTLTGTGCMATTMVAAFAAVERDYLLAAAGGLAMFGLAAELAAEKAHGPASFKTALFDQIYNLTPEQVAAGARIAELER